MAKYKAYPEYKDSGVEWLGEIPIHWEILRHKYVAFFTKGKIPTNLLEQPLKNTLPYLSMECLRNNTTDKYALISNDVRIVLEGQPLIIWDGSNAGEFFKGKSGILSSTMATATLTYPLHPQYYWYVCISIEPEMRKNAVGMGIPHVNGDELKSISVSIPSFCEQKQIAVFLDHETAKIDNLIEKQQQLIELLKEKRQAVISHAVTKGLNPDVPMKDSGVEWLGDVPKHWIPARLKYHTRQIVDGAHFTPTYTEKGIPFLRVTDIQDKYIDFDNIKFIPEHEHKELIKRCRPENGDLLLSKNGTIGVPKLVDWDWEFSIFVSLCLIKFKSTLTPEYSEFYFKSHEIKEQIFGLIKQSTVINLHLDKIQNFWFCIPPLEEQYKIVNYLNEKIDTLECLIENAELTIRLAQERRTALISAAVTGKIDVRDWVAPDTQDIEELQEATV